MSTPFKMRHPVYMYKFQIRIRILRFLLFVIRKEKTQQRISRKTAFLTNVGAKDRKAFGFIFRFALTVKKEKKERESKCGNVHINPMRMLVWRFH